MFVLSTFFFACTSRKNSISPCFGSVFYCVSFFCLTFLADSFSKEGQVRLSIKIKNGRCSSSGLENSFFVEVYFSYYREKFSRCKIWPSFSDQFFLYKHCPLQAWNAYVVCGLLIIIRLLAWAVKSWGM